MNDVLKSPFTKAEIKYICATSYDNDFQVMLLNYETRLSIARGRCDQKQIAIFTREIKTINEMIEGGEDEKGN